MGAADPPPAGSSILHMKSSPLSLASVVVALLLTACAPWNKVTRHVPDREKPGPFAPAENARIESSGPDARYGCSFVEFDGKGGYLKYSQLLQAQGILKKKAAQGRVLLVIYCHGWNNNAQSGNVVKFVGFLHDLANSPAIQEKGFRVEGVYLSWRGSQYRSAPPPDQFAAERALAGDFQGQPLLDRRELSPGFLRIPEGIAALFSYWSIKDRAEHHVSTIPIGNTIFSLAYQLKNPRQPGGDQRNRVFVLGHSFGGLVLERTLGLASVGLLNADWAYPKSEARWPFDLIVFLNSAAPSIYAKQLSEFLENDRRVTASPRIVSITSVADKATKWLHYIGNIGTALPGVAPDLQREYYPDARKDAHGKTIRGKPVTAWQYYAHTPGHNEHLIDRDICSDCSAPIPLAGSDVDVFRYNLSPANRAKEFFTRGQDGKVAGWSIVNRPEDQHRHYSSSYWIITAPKAIIPNHNDIWSETSKQMLAGIYHTAEVLRKKEAPPQKAPEQKRQPD